MSLSASKTAKPFVGYTETTLHALRLVYAASQGVIPRITRRLTDAEREAMIKTGAVFVFGVEESGIHRWTDGLLWSRSRTVGNYLVYQELKERSRGHGIRKRSDSMIEDHNRILLSGRPRDERSTRPLASSYGGMDLGIIKPNGLTKKTITVTVDDTDLHLVSYYTQNDILSGRLDKPNSRPDIMGLDLPPEIFRLSNLRDPPKVKIGPDGRPQLVSDPEDTESVHLREPLPALEMESLCLREAPQCDGESLTLANNLVQNPHMSLSSPFATPVPISPIHNDHFYSGGTDQSWTPQFDATQAMLPTHKEMSFQMSDQRPPLTPPEKNPVGLVDGDGFFWGEDAPHGSWFSSLTEKNFANTTTEPNLDQLLRSWILLPETPPRVIDIV